MSESALLKCNETKFILESYFVGLNIMVPISIRHVALMSYSLCTLFHHAYYKEIRNDGINYIVTVI